MPEALFLPAYKKLECTSLIAKSLIQRNSATLNGQTITLNEIQDIETFSLGGSLQLNYLN